MNKRILSLAIVCTFGFHLDHPAESAAVNSEEGRARAKRTVGGWSAFELSRGQFGPDTDFGLRSEGYTVSVNRKGASLRLDSRESHGGPARRDGLRIRMIDAQRSTVGTGNEALTGRVNYLIGPDPTAWVTNVPTYAGVTYAGVYQGVDLVYHARGRNLEYDFVVSPGADVAAVRLRITGAERVELDANGDLKLETRAGSVSFAKPEAYQDVDGSRFPVVADFVVLDTREVGFAVGSYDMTKPLVIDPVVYYSTYLGGAATDVTVAVATDVTGAAYVAGWTTSLDFPVTGGAYEPNPRDLFIAKLSPAGDALVYATYLGGTLFDSLEDLAVDASGAVYVVGRTNSDDFPTTPGAYDVVCGDGVACGGTEQDVFVSKLSASGSTLEYSTYIGGDQDDQGLGIALDAGGAAYLTGYTSSTDYPVTVGAFDTSLSGLRDVFVSKLDATGQTLVYSTYLGGSGSSDYGTDIQVEADGTAHVAGRTHSTDFPVTVGAFDTTCGTDGGCNGGFNDDLFVAKVNASGTALDFATFLGGSNSEVNSPRLALDADGATYVTGDTGSTDFPTTPSAFQTTSGGGQTAFVTKLSAAGDALVYSTYLGGSVIDIALAIDVDELGTAYVAGLTYSEDFPVTPNALDQNLGGTKDAFVATLSPDGASLLYGTYLGGGSDETAWGIAYDSDYSVFVTGETRSLSFPTTPGAFDTTCGGCSSGDAFVTHLLVGPPTPPPPVCAATPEPDGSCRLADVSGSGKSSLQIKDDPMAAKDSFKWKWSRGVATSLGDFKAPDVGTATYHVCIYDGSGATQPLIEADIPAGGVVPLCGTKPCWAAAGTTGFKYKNKGATPDGITGVKVKAGAAGKARLQIRGKGALLAPPATGALVTDVVVQLLIDDGGPFECFKTSFPGSSGAGVVTTQDATQFKAKGP